MPKPFKIPAPKERRKEPGEYQGPWACSHAHDIPRTSLTPEMLRAAAAAYLDRQKVTLWGRSFAVIDEDREMAEDFIVDVVSEVLGEMEGAST